MDKKELKFYEAPAQEVVELNTQGCLLSYSDPEEPTLPEQNENPEL